MFLIIIAVIATLICIASLIYGPRIKDSSSAQFKACVAVSAVTLVTAAGCGFVAFTTFDMGDVDAVEQVVVDNRHDLWIPQDGTPLVIDSVQNEQGEWCYAIHVINLATMEENMLYPPASVTTFLDPVEENRYYMDWTEKYAKLGDKEFHAGIGEVKLGYRNDAEMNQAIQSKLVGANCVVYIPRGTIVNRPPVMQPVAEVEPNAVVEPNAGQVVPNVVQDPNAAVQQPDPNATPQANPEQPAQ